MSVKTDYLKDCITGNTITIQELINLRDQVAAIPDSGAIMDDVNAAIQKIEATMQVELEQTKEEIEKEVTTQINALKAEITEYKIKLLEIYNKVTQFKFKKVQEIQRNMNNDITKIIFTDNSYIEVEYNNLPYENEYINYMPTKLNYYDSTGKIIAIEEISYQNESIIGLNNTNI
jgi:hypothetical protein